MEIVIETDDVKDWVYKGEGGANIILSYRGSSPLLVGKPCELYELNIKFYLWGICNQTARWHLVSLNYVLYTSVIIKENQKIL